MYQRIQSCFYESDVFSVSSRARPQAPLSVRAQVDEVPTEAPVGALAVVTDLPGEVALPNLGSVNATAEEVRTLAWKECSAERVRCKAENIA